MRRLQPLLLLFVAVFVAACAGILGIKKRDNTRPFEHRRHSLAGVSCVDCHEGIQTAGEDGPLHLPTTATCVKCHSKPHDTRDCGSCHGTTHARDGAALARKHLKFEHKGHLANVKGQCVPCHANAGGPDSETLRPAMAQCFTCHQHKDKWRVRDCDSCHHDLPSEHIRPASHVLHEGDFIREHGVRAAASRDLCATCHSQSSCDVCHGKTTAILPWRLEVQSPTLARLHPANFMARHPEESRAQPGLCSTCHSESACLGCHADRNVSAKAGVKSPHPPGWVRAVGGEHGRAARLDPMGCASCHGGAGEMLCVGCHRVGGSGGTPHGPGFSSTKDKLRDEPCRLCHAL